MPGRCRRCRISRSSRRACGDPRSRAPGCRRRALRSSRCACGDRHSCAAGHLRCWTLWSSRRACGDPRSCTPGCRRCRTLRSSSRSCGDRRSCAAGCVQRSAGSGGLAFAAGSRRVHAAVLPSVCSRVGRIARQDRWLSLPEFSPSFRRPALAHSRGHPRHPLRPAAWPCAARFRGILAARPLTNARARPRACSTRTLGGLAFIAEPCRVPARPALARSLLPCCARQDRTVRLRQRSTPAAFLARHRVLALSP